MPEQDRKLRKGFSLSAELVEGIFTFGRIPKIFDVGGDVAELFLVVIDERGFLTLACEVAVLVGGREVRGIVHSDKRLSI